MIRWSAFVLLLILVALAQSVAAQTPIAPITIDVEGNVITVAPADADAFTRRINRPPLLDNPPVASAPSYTVTTAYWNDAVREDDAEPMVAEEAEYFPVGGFVRARQGDADAWIVLDLRQRALLNRYIRYATETPRPNLVNPEPGALLVVFLKAFGVGEPVGIEAGSRRFTPEEARSFWESVAPHLDPLRGPPVFLEPPQPPEPTATGYWVTFTLPEGRSLIYYLDPPAGTLTDSLGTESYDISTAAGGGIPESVSTLRIEQEDPAGSALWWLLAALGGAFLLGLVAWTRRHSNP